VATVDDVRAFALSLPRAYEALVRDSVKFRVGQLVFVAISPDETLIGFGFPRDEREALVASDPARFLMPIDSDLRYQWVRARLRRLTVAEVNEFVFDAWQMVVPKKVVTAYREQVAGP
jgi:hypothetical protein